MSLHAGAAVQSWRRDGYLVHCCTTKAYSIETRLAGAPGFFTRVHGPAQRKYQGRTSLIFSFVSVLMATSGSRLVAATSLSRSACCSASTLAQNLSGSWSRNNGLSMLQHIQVSVQDRASKTVIARLVREGAQPNRMGS